MLNSDVVKRCSGLKGAYLPQITIWQSKGPSFFCLDSALIHFVIDHGKKSPQDESAFCSAAFVLGPHLLAGKYGEASEGQKAS